MIKYCKSNKTRDAKLMICDIIKEGKEKNNNNNY